MKLTWAYPVVIQHFYSYQLLLFDWHAPKIASCPPDDQQTTFYLYAAHIQHTYSQHPCAPTPQIHFKRQLILCYCLLTWHQRHIFPAEAQSTGRDSLGWGTGLTWTGAGGRGEGGQREPPRADWLKSPKFSATTTDHNCWRPLEVWGQVCLFCLLAK